MTRALIILRTEADRNLACKWIRGVPEGSRVEFKKPRRTLPQNDRMWAMLTDMATQTTWFGQKLTPDGWKDLLSAHFRKCECVPGIDPGTVVPLGLRTSDMSKEEMSDFLECIAAFGAERGVTFGDER